jgi:carboxypeptidase family protein
MANPLSVGHASIARFALALSLLTGTVGGRLGAQGTIRGRVTNEVGASLADALVVLDPAAGNMGVRTGLDGLFHFDRVRTGEHVLRVLHLGYFPRDTVVSVSTQRVDVSVVLMRLPSTLDTVHVLTASTGIRGIVVSRSDNQPVNGASVAVQSTRLQTRTASNGAFEFSDAREGAYVLYVKADGFLPRIMSVQVPSAGGVQVLVAVQRMGTIGTKKLAQPLAEFDTRVRFAVTANSALIPRQELLGHEGQSIADALNYSITFLRKGLRLSGPCVYIDGVWSPGATLDAYSVSDIEAIEVYGYHADWTGTLAQRAVGYQCSASAGSSQAGTRRSKGGSSPAVAAIVLWLKHAPS